MRTRRFLAAATALGCLVAIVGGQAPPAGAAPPVYIETEIPAPGPRGSLAVIGDSVMLGSTWDSGGYGPSVGVMLAGQGWGPVLQKAGVGFQTGRFLSAGHGANMTTWLNNRRAMGWDASTFVVSLGHNEVASCFGNVACAVESVDRFLDVIGPGHQVWWTKITMPDPADAATWNQALDTVAARRAELVVWDWPAVIATSGIPISRDGVHLPTASAYRARSQLIADDVTARRGSALALGTVVTPPATDGTAGATTGARYEPLPPTRVLDTRTAAQRLARAGIHVLDLAGHTPPGTTAVSVNLAADAPDTAGFLTAWPCTGQIPTASSLNVTAGTARSAHVVVPVDSGRRLCIYASTATDVIVDLQGVFGSSGTDRFTPSSPSRLVDTRASGRSSPVVVAAPAGATAVALNVTATNPSLPGYLTTFPCGGEMPVVANVNFRAGETVGGAAFVPVGADGTICVFSNAPTDVIVDLTGTFASTGALSFAPATPLRMLDTRDGTGQWLGRVGPGQTIDIPVAPPGARAATGTLTMIDPAVDAHLTAYPCGEARPPTSSLNGARSAIVANSVTAGISAEQELCLQAPVSMHIVFDATGWWVP